MMAVLLMVLFFVIGLTYYDPPISYGMEVSFGNLNQGSGNVQPQKKTASKPSELKNESNYSNHSTYCLKSTTPAKTPHRNSDRKRICSERTHKRMFLHKEIQPHCK